MPLATSTSAKALQRPSADKAVWLYDGSLLIAYWNGSNGQVAQVTSPLTSPSVTNQFTTAEDGVSLWADNSSGTSSYIWVASSFDDASGSGPGIHLRSGTYAGGTFTWNTATVVPGSTQADTIQCSVTWNGTYLMVFWWDGVSGSDRIAYNWTTDKTGQTGWLSAAYAACFSESNAWSTVMAVAARHSANLSATIVNYAGNSRMHYGCMPDSASSGPVTGATLSATSSWSGSTSTSVTAGAVMVVRPSGTTPVYSLGTVSQATATSGSLTGTWNTDQVRTSGDLLVAVASATGTTSATTPSTATSGWSSQMTAGNATKAAVAVWTKTAAGSDAAPTFTSTISGTAAMTVTLFVLKNAATSSFIDTSGTTTGTAGAGFSVTTSGNVATNGCFAVAGMVRERAATSTTYTPGIGWANVVNDGAVSSTGHCSVDAMCGPAVSRWGGRTTFDTLFTDSFGFGGCPTVIDEASGTVHVARAVPNVGGPTMGPGICYWKGTYNGSPTNTVTYTGSLTVDSTSTATGPPDVTIGVDKNGKVYVVWVTDQSSDSMKYATLASPYTSATAGGTFSTGGSSPRWPHVPPVSQAQAGLTDALPVLYTDTTATPFPVSLDTSVTLPSGGGTVSGTASLSASSALTSGGVIAGAAALTAAGSMAAPATQGSGAPLAASSALSAGAAQQAGASLAAASSLAASAATSEQGSASLAASSSLTAAAVQGAVASLAALASLAAPAVQESGVTLAAGTALSAPAVQRGGAALAAASALSAPAVQEAAASLAAASSLAAPAAQEAGASLAAASALTASASGTASGTATLAAASSLAAGVVQEAGASLAAVSSLTAVVAGTGGAALTAASSLSAPVVQRAGAVLAASSALAAGAGSAVPGSASLAAGSSLAAGGAVSGAAPLAALSVLTAPARQGAGAALTALSAVSAPSAQRPGAVLAAAAALAATAAQRGPFTVGILTSGTQSGVNGSSTYAPTGATSTSSGALAAATSP